MADIRSWIICVCAVCIAGAIISLLLPSDRVSESVIAVLRLISVTVVLLPLFNMNIPKELKIDNFPMPENEETYVNDSNADNLLIMQTKKVLLEELEGIVSLYYGDKYEIDADMDILADQSIHIKRIQITLYNDDADIGSLKNALLEFCPQCEIVITKKDGSSLE